MATRTDYSLSDSVAEEIRAMLARRRISGRKLAEQLGVSSAWVSYRLTGSQEIGLNALQRIAEVLDVAVTDLLPTQRSGSTTPRYRHGDPRLLRTAPVADVRSRPVFAPYEMDQVAL